MFFRFSVVVVSALGTSISSFASSTRDLSCDFSRNSHVLPPPAHRITTRMFSTESGDTFEITGLSLPPQFNKATSQNTLTEFRVLFIDENLPRRSNGCFFQSKNSFIYSCDIHSQTALNGSYRGRAKYLDGHTEEFRLMTGVPVDASEPMLDLVIEQSTNVKLTARSLLKTANFKFLLVFSRFPDEGHPSRDTYMLENQMSPGFENCNKVEPTESR